MSMSDTDLEQKRALEYWTRRCEAAELYISKIPCSPDTSKEQYEAFTIWTDIIDEELTETEKELITEDRGWVTGKVKCDLCGFEWEVKYNINITTLECPSCKRTVSFENID